MQNRSSPYAPDRGSGRQGDKDTGCLSEHGGEARGVGFIPTLGTLKSRDGYLQPQSFGGTFQVKPTLQPTRLCVPTRVHCPRCFLPAAHSGRRLALPQLLHRSTGVPHTPTPGKGNGRRVSCPHASRSRGPGSALMLVIKGKVTAEQLRGSPQLTGGRDLWESSM